MRHAPLHVILIATAFAAQPTLPFLASLLFVPKTQSHPETLGHTAAHGAIAEATSPEAAEAEPTGDKACGPKDHPGSCADLATFGTALFQEVLRTPRRDGSKNSEGGGRMY